MVRERHHIPELEGSSVLAGIAEMAFHIVGEEGQEMHHTPVLGDTAEVEGIAEGAHHTVEGFRGKLHSLLLPLDIAEVGGIVGIGLAAGNGPAVGIGPAVGRGSGEDIDPGRGTGQLEGRKEAHMGVGHRTEADTTFCVSIGMGDVCDQPAKMVGQRNE